MSAPIKTSKRNRSFSKVVKTKKSNRTKARVSTKVYIPQANKTQVSVKPSKLVGKKLAQKMIDILCQTYPNAHCELSYKNDYELLVAVILSAQCTDSTVNKVTPALFKRFPTPKSLAEAPLEEVKIIIRPTGFFNAKAQNIQACAQALVNQFGGKVPNNFDELIKLPGVGRKTANAVLGVAHNIAGWTVDTHVKRLSNRLGLTENENPDKIEQDLIRLFPNQDWCQLSITLIWHGRRCCFARNPDCAHCPINHLCPSSLV